MRRHRAAPKLASGIGTGRATHSDRSSDSGTEPAVLSCWGQGGIDRTRPSRRRPVTQHAGLKTLTARGIVAGNHPGGVTMTDATSAPSAAPTVVLAHGAWADATG